MTKVLPVILCGGSGSRLWPLSRSGLPKQFVVLADMGINQSLFQQTIERVYSSFNNEISAACALVVTGEDHRFLALDQLRELRTVNPQIAATLLLEPCGKNTAPALTLAALCALESGEDPILVVTPADQVVENTSAFTAAINKSIALARDNSIVILGITPKSAETGYGYIKVSENNQDTLCLPRLVERFIEKPNQDAAKKYLDEGGFFWNSGIFVLKASVWIEALKQFRPDILSATQAAWQKKTVDVSAESQFIRPSKEMYEAIPSESIDYAVIEKSPGSLFDIKMVELDAGWNDLGSWDAVWQVGPKDERGNLVTGDTLISDVNNSLICANSRLVGVVGVENVIIVETPDALLVINRENSQAVKRIFAQLEREGRPEKNLHRKVSRPWGWYDSVDEGDGFKVKRIQVKPGASLSLQMHRHRAEHWIVVKGTAQITNGDRVLTLTENQSTYIPQGQIHCLSNPNQTPLEIIEVQSGSYLGEDDIVRFEDAYGRS